MRFVRVIALALLVVAVPVFLIATSARIVIFSGWLYNYGFEKYQIAEVTGIEKPELLSASRQIKVYFTNDQEFLDVRIHMKGEDWELYNGREIAHMADVKGLIKGVAMLERASLVLIIGIALSSLLLSGRRQAFRFMSWGVCWGGVLTGALIVVAGLGSLVAFEPMFIFFHHLSFSNDLWLLDPRTDYLLVMFPEGFFLDATLCIAGFALAGATLGATAAWWLLQRSRVSADASGPAKEQG